MIQFLLCTLIGTLAFALFRTWSTSLASMHKVLDGALQIPIACDVLRRDLHAAMPTDVEVEPDRCVIKSSRRRIQWQFKKGTLTRALSNFDVKQKRWKKSVKNVAAERTGNIRFSPMKSPEMHEVSGVKLIDEPDQIICIITLRNGKAL